MGNDNDTQYTFEKTTYMYTSKLQSIYILTIGLCIFQCVWITWKPLYILISPILNSSESSQQVTYKSLLQKLDGPLLPPKLIAKYEGQTLVHLTHIWPGLLWSGSIPFQLHPSLRKNHPRTHRIIGRIFMFSSLMIHLGFIVIMSKGLFFENFLENENDVTLIPFVRVSSASLSVSVLALWFLYTGLMALWYARQRNIQLHQYYIIRHIGSGIWISFQRVLLLIYVTFRNTVVGVDQPPLVRPRDAFGMSATIAIIVSVSLSEYTVFMFKQICVKKE